MTNPVLAIDHAEAIKQLDHVHWYLQKAQELLAAPAHAALYVTGAYPVPVVHSVADAAGLVRHLRLAFANAQKREVA